MRADILYMHERTTVDKLPSGLGRKREGVKEIYFMLSRQLRLYQGLSRLYSDKKSDLVQ